MLTKKLAFKKVIRKLSSKISAKYQLDGVILAGFLDPSMVWDAWNPNIDFIYLKPYSLFRQHRRCFSNHQLASCSGGRAGCPCAVPSLVLGIKAQEGLQQVFRTTWTSWAFAWATLGTQKKMWSWSNKSWCLLIVSISIFFKCWTTHWTPNVWNWEGWSHLLFFPPCPWCQLARWLSRLRAPLLVPRMDTKRTVSVTGCLWQGEKDKSSPKNRKED